MKYALQDGRIVYPFVLEAEEANSHLIADPRTGEALLVDVGEYAAAIRDTVRERRLEVQAILVTHTHHDHVEGLEEAVSDLGAEVLVHRAGISSLAAGGARGVVDLELLEIGGFRIRVLATEGHTRDSCCYLVGEALFTGDTLFNGSVGGTASRDLFLRETDNIKAKILSLPDHLAIFPGHGPPTTVGIERTCNPFLG